MDGNAGCTLREANNGAGRRTMHQDISFGSVTPNNIGIVKSIHNACFPLVFSDRLYSLILEDRQLCTLAYVKDVAVGVVSCRMDPYMFHEKTPTETGEGDQEGNSRGSIAVDECFQDYDEARAAQGCSEAQSNKKIKWDLALVRTPHRQQHYRLCVLTLAVLEPYRRCGIGKALMGWAMERFEALRQGLPLQQDSTSTLPCVIPGVPLHVDYIFLHVWCGSMEAQTFYTSLGFKKEDTIEDYYQKLRPSASCVFIKTP